MTFYDLVGFLYFKVSRVSATTLSTEKHLLVEKTLHVKVGVNSARKVYSLLSTIKWTLLTHSNLQNFHIFLGDLILSSEAGPYKSTPIAT